MGASVCFTNHIEIADKSKVFGPIKCIGYNDITPKMINEIVCNSQIERIQISQELPAEAYQLIDRILEKRRDLFLRIYNIHPDRPFDLSNLMQMPHLSKVWIDACVYEDNRIINPEYLCELPNLKCLHLYLFDCLDYRFVNNLSHNLEELLLFADTMGRTIKFDCEWLLQYKKLRSLTLGKKAKKNLESIRELTNLNSLALRGIKVKDFDFIKELHLHTFRLLYCGNSDLSKLGEFESLRELELWRILKLENIDFISSLINLEILKLQDLNRINSLPDLSRLAKLKKIRLCNVPIDKKSLDKDIEKLIC